MFSFRSLSSGCNHGLRLPTTVRFALLRSFLTMTVILTMVSLIGITGCDEAQEEKEPTKILKTDPAHGGEMLAGSSFTIVFDGIVTDVEVNGIRADIAGTRVTLGSERLEFGEQTLKIEWIDENGNAGSKEVTLIVTADIAGEYAMHADFTGICRIPGLIASETQIGQIGVAIITQNGNKLSIGFRSAPEEAEGEVHGSLVTFSGGLPVGSADTSHFAFEGEVDDTGTISGTLSGTYWTTHYSAHQIRDIHFSVDEGSLELRPTDTEEASNNYLIDGFPVTRISR